MARTVFLVVAVLAAGTACGAGGPSREDFANQANPVCATSNAELSGIVRPTDLKQLGEVSGKVADSTDKQAAALDKLAKPKGGSKALTDSIASMRAVAASGQKVRTAAGSGDTRTVEPEVETLRAEATKADEAARSYGLAECGKGARDAAATIADAAKPILKQEFIAKADALCADLNRKIDAIPEPETPREVVKALDDSLALYDKLVADFKTLHVPAAEQAAWNDILAANDKVAGLLREGRGAIAAEDETRAERLFEEVGTATADANKKADAFGFKDCGSNA